MNQELSAENLDTQIQAGLSKIRGAQIMMLQAAAEIGKQFQWMIDAAKSGKSNYTCERIYQESGFSAMQCGNYIRFYEQWGNKLDKVSDNWGWSALLQLSSLPAEVAEQVVAENPQGLSKNGAKEEVKRLKEQLDATKRQLSQTELALKSNTENFTRDLERINAAKKLREKDFQKEFDDALKPYQNMAGRYEEQIEKYKCFVENLKEEKKTMFNIITQLENDKTKYKTQEGVIEENKRLRAELEDLRSQPIDGVVVSSSSRTIDALKLATELLLQSGHGMEASILEGLANSLES